jgi:hypothetical protein
MIGNERYQRREELLVLYGKLADREESKALGEKRQLKHELPNGDVEVYDFYHSGAVVVMELVDVIYPTVPTDTEQDENPYFKKEFIPKEYQTTEPPIFTEPMPAVEPVAVPVETAPPVELPNEAFNGELVAKRKPGRKPKAQ